MTELFSVCQFFEDGTYHYWKRNVGVKEALEAAKHLTTNVASRVGITTRVIITDSDDHIAWEWERGKGITFPKGGTYEPAEGI
jgi:hypothetical protein